MIEKKYYIRLEIEFLIMFFIFLWFIYSNYNYILFKVLIGHGYIFTDSLDKIYAEELKTDDFSLSKDFDNVVISVMTKKIQDESNDIYTQFYLKDEYSRYVDKRKKDGTQSHIDVIDNDTVKFTFTNFSSSCRKEFIKNISELKKYKNIVLDLRNNGGGTLTDAYKISDYFLERGSIICREETRFPFLTRTIKAKKAQKLKFDSIVILQNEYTASSAEVFINALNDNLDNTVIDGKTSYGKGIGQAEFRLKNGYGIKATVIRLITPKGNCINQIGIKPDIKDYNMYPD